VRAERERARRAGQVAGDTAFDDRHLDRLLEQKTGGQQFEPERHLFIAPDRRFGLETNVPILVVAQLLQRWAAVEPALYERGGGGALRQVRDRRGREAVTGDARRRVGHGFGRSGAGHARERDGKHQQPIPTHDFLRRQRGSRPQGEGGVDAPRLRLA
jgi:hypothetical protein